MEGRHALRCGGRGQGWEGAETPSGPVPSGYRGERTHPQLLTIKGGQAQVLIPNFLTSWPVVPSTGVVLPGTVTKGYQIYGNQIVMSPW